MPRTLTLVFIVLTFLCWGSYGPVLHEGQGAMGGGGRDLWRPFIFVGIAYFLVAVCGPLILGRFREEPGQWGIRGVLWSLLAGAVGALGSLGILLAFSKGGSPLFVMPLVFGCAPVVNTVFTMLTNHTARNATWPFFLGILLVALGAAGVLRFKPSSSTGHVGASVRIEFEGKAPEVEGASVAGNTLVVRGDKEESIAQLNRRVLPLLLGQGTDVIGIRDASVTPLAAVMYIVLTAFCWGTYGPLLHRGQVGMGGSRMRPFLCVGVAYFVVAIIVPVVILIQTHDSGSTRFAGAVWSLAAGTLGAVGALGVLLAFNSGGKPIFVMPLVFGGAPLVNTAISSLQAQWSGHAIGPLTWQFVSSLGMVIMGAIAVLLFAPRAKHGSTPSGGSAKGGEKHPPSPAADRDTSSKKV